MYEGNVSWACASSSCLEGCCDIMDEFLGDALCVEVAISDGILLLVVEEYLFFVTKG